MKTKNKVITMQSLKDLAYMVSKKKAKVKVFSNKEICQLSPLNMCENKKSCYIQDLLGITPKRTNFKLTPIRTNNFQFKPFDIAVILK